MAPTLHSRRVWSELLTRLPKQPPPFRKHPAPTVSFRPLLLSPGCQRGAECGPNLVSLSYQTAHEVYQRGGPWLGGHVLEGAVCPHDEAHESLSRPHDNNCAAHTESLRFPVTHSMTHRFPWSLLLVAHIETLWGAFRPWGHRERIFKQMHKICSSK